MEWQHSRRGRYIWKRCGNYKGFWTQYGAGLIRSGTPAFFAPRFLLIYVSDTQVSRAGCIGGLDSRFGQFVYTIGRLGESYTFRAMILILNTVYTLSIYLGESRWTRRGYS